jgi:hypothetical protein
MSEGGGGLDREGGKRHGNNSNAIAKLFKMIVLITVKKGFR